MKDWQHWTYALVSYSPAEAPLEKDMIFSYSDQSEICYTVVSCIWRLEENTFWFIQSNCVKGNLGERAGVY